jgi:cytochrome bd-type quinol oxidase subunit 2
VPIPQEDRAVVPDCAEKFVNLAFLLFVSAMLAVCSLAVLRGGQDERIAAIGIAAAAVMTPLMTAHGFAGPEMGIVLVDIALFLVLATIAMRSRSFWPLWAAGFQLCGLAGHLAAAKSPEMLPAAYAETLAIWSYAVMTSLAVGAVVEGRADRGHG